MPRIGLPLLAAVLSLLAAAPAASAADCAGADLALTAANVTQVRGAALCLANAERAAAGVPALVAQDALQAAGQAFAQRMVDEQYFGHVAPDGSTLRERAAGYAGWTALGENLAWGEGSLATARSTIASWMGSPGHRANLLSGAFTELGVGVALGAPIETTRPAATWVVTFGARAAADADAAATPVGSAAGATPAQARSTTTTRELTEGRKARARRSARRCVPGKVARAGRSASGRRMTRCLRARKR